MHEFCIVSQICFVRIILYCSFCVLMGLYVLCVRCAFIVGVCCMHYCVECEFCVGFLEVLVNLILGRLLVFVWVY